MHLRDWLEREGLSIAWVARQLGVHAPDVSKWINGRGAPHLWYAQQIHVLTSGEVSIMDWPIGPARKTSSGIVVKPYKRPESVDDESGS